MIWISSRATSSTITTQVGIGHSPCLRKCSGVGRSYLWSGKDETMNLHKEAAKKMRQEIVRLQKENAELRAEKETAPEIAGFFMW